VSRDCKGAVRSLLQHPVTRCCILLAALLPAYTHDIITTKVIFDREIGVSLATYNDRPLYIAVSSRTTEAERSAP
jgi:hypothetical protein